MNFKYILSLLFTSNQHKAVNSLHKQTSKQEYTLKFNRFIERNFYIIALASIIILLVLFVIVCYLIVGVSATESGTVYNHFNGVI